MFDWLLGSGGKDRQALADQRAQANDVYGQYDKWFNGLSEDQRSQFNTQAGGNFLDTLKNETVGAADTAWNDYSKKSRNDTFGNGVLGALLNPFAQTATAAGDLATGQYQKKGRDMMSDLGALGESALSLVPLAGGAMKALKLGKAGSALTRGVNSVPGMAVTGAGIGGLEALRQGGSETQLQDILSQTGMGALFGGGAPLAGRAVNKGLMTRGAKNYNPEGVYGGLTQARINPLQAAHMAADPSSRTLRSVGMRNIMPKSRFGKIATGAGAVAGGGMLMNGMGGQQPAMGGQMTEEQLYNYLVSQGMM